MDGRIVTFVERPNGGSFGFLRSEDDREDDLFFTSSAARGHVAVGDHVSYMIGRNKRGRCAVCVLPVDSEPDAHGPRRFRLLAPER